MVQYQKQNLDKLKKVFNSVIEAVEHGYYTEHEGLSIGDINYAEIRDWAGMKPESDNRTSEEILEDRMIEDVCYLVRQAL